MSLYQRALGIPFVYNHIRPLVVGGVDMTPSYQNLAAGPDDVIVDVGCGPGSSLTYLQSFRSLHGFDTDPVAIAFARKAAAGRENVSFEARAVTAADLEVIKPTRVMMNGLLHHLDNPTAIELLDMCARLPSVQRVATQDVVYLDGEHLSNLFARFDRGKHVRTVEGYRALIGLTGLSITEERIVRSHPKGGRALYLLMALERRREGGRDGTS